MPNLDGLTYDHTLDIELTVADMLSITCALYEARKWNQQNNYPNCASDINNLIDRWRSLTEDYVAQADLETRKALGK